MLKQISQEEFLSAENSNVFILAKSTVAHNYFLIENHKEKKYAFASEYDMDWQINFGINGLFVYVVGDIIIAIDSDNILQILLRTFDPISSYHIINEKFYLIGENSVYSLSSLSFFIHNYVHLPDIITEVHQLEDRLQVKVFSYQEPFEVL